MSVRTRSAFAFARKKGGKGGETCGGKKTGGAVASAARHERVVAVIVPTYTLSAMAIGSLVQEGGKADGVHGN